MTTSADQMIDCASSLAVVLAKHAVEGEELRRLPDPVLDAALEAELFKMVVPKRWGGAGLGLDTLAHSTRIMGSGCPSAAWTLSFLTMHNWLLTRFAEKLQEEVFGARGFALAPAPLAPTGRMAPTDGGYRITGRWEWATGICHADWVIVQALVPGPVLETRFAVLPVEEVEVDDIWHTSGMRATGSNTVRIEDRFVPEYRTLASDQLRAGATADLEDGLSAYPVTPVLCLVAAAPALGAAETAVELFRERIRERVLAFSAGDRAIDQQSMRIRLAAAIADGRAARVVFDRAVADVQQAVGRAAGLSLAGRAAARLAAANVVRRSREVIELVCAGAGASVYFSSSPLQRLQRDVEVLKGHVVFDWDRTADLAGRIELGFDPLPTDLL